MTAATDEGDGRSARKRRAILDAARTLFLRNGYAGTSMDDVAALAAVSKQTVYKNFADKQRLFTEFIGSDIAQVEGSTHALIEPMPDTQNLEADLRAFARRHLADVMQPHLLQMRRVLIGEAERFPELAQTWYENGPERSCAIFARWFDRAGPARPAADPGSDAGRPALQLADPVDPGQQGDGVAQRPAPVHPGRARPLRRRGGTRLPRRLRRGMTRCWD